jgi:hypothetical protein
MRALAVALPRRREAHAQAAERSRTIEFLNLEERGQGPAVTAAGLKSAKDEQT